MKKYFIIPLFLIFIALNVSAGFTAVSELSASEKNGLLRMREEEKLARDVYLFLYDKFKIKIFKNISASEQQHMDSVLTLLNMHGIEDPVGSDRRGIFKNTEMQSLYDTLINAGSRSAADALKTGATVEDLDIMDLMNLLKTNSNKDIKIVYENLLKGSRNHLRSFVKQLKQYKTEYKPQYISNDEFNSIINSPMERGK